MSRMPEYTFNQRHLIRDGQPWLPTMGEFHYARYPRAQWRQELQKMKACGVDIVATYVFWNQHEATQGVYDFSGQRDVGAFLTLCQEEDLLVWFRIGPWCHGESRHGGFPDWLQNAGIPLRCDDAPYMAHVRRFWQALYAQSHHALYREGGPIIGIQIENEFGHCGGSGKNEHINNLKALANEIGFEAPYYTATGWGGAVIGDLLPVMGCYCDAPWDRRLAPLPPSPNYIFSHERNDVDVGSDFRRGANVTFDEDAYPYLLAEMGGGINSTFHRRPTATPADTGAMALTKLGSGANLVGYYMYHGGTNPGDDLNETRESGSWCETPTLTYAPRSPIGEYGQVGDLAKEVKLLAMFTHDFGPMLAPMDADIPADSAARPADADSPRYAWRMKDGAGFLFINNHQRGLDLPARALNAAPFGPIDVPAGYYGILPVNLPTGGATLRHAKASPLCILNGDAYVFFCDGDPAYALEGNLGSARISTLTRAEALNAWRVTRNGCDTLILCDAPVVQNAEGIHILARTATPWRDVLTGETGTAMPPTEAPTAEATRTRVNYQCYEYDIDLTYGPDSSETYLTIDYAGSLAELFIDGQRVADDMYDGSLWEVGLARFGRPARVSLRIYALFEGMPVWLQNPPAYVDGRALRLNAVSIQNEYRIAL